MPNPRLVLRLRSLGPSLRGSAPGLAALVALLAVAGFVALVATAARLGAQPRGAAPRDIARVVAFDTTEVAPYVPREFRGVWLSSADGSDWPSRPGMSAQRQQDELVALLDRARAVGLNAVIFHVRLSGDAFYPTPLAPWSHKLTGTQGAEPGWDPLALVIREAHARGLQVHAWFNPFRASLDDGIRAAPTHVTRAHPAWVVRYGPQQWIDPGIPAAREAVLQTVLDVVNRYDVDGVHIDDYFYPYQETRTIVRRVGKGKRRHTVRKTEVIAFPDTKSWKLHGGAKRGFRSRDDWRRHNIDDFIATLYTRVHAAKWWVMVGVSPFGIWRPGAPAGISGLDAYSEIYADSRKWLREGWVDYLAPQLYWPIDGVQNRFRVLDGWWRTQNPMGRHVWPGLYTVGSTSRGVWAPDEISRQIAFLRDGRRGSAEADGHIHFRIASFATDSLARALGDRLEREEYDGPALVPAAPWLAAVPTPGAPVARLVDDLSGPGPLLLLGVRDSTPLAWWLVQTRTDGRWTSKIREATARQFLLSDIAPGADLIVVRAIDRVGRAGERAAIKVVLPRMGPR